MTEYQKVPIKQYPRLPSQRTPEWAFWQKYSTPKIIKEYASVTSVTFSAVSPHDFAVTSSTRVQVYNARTHAVRKTISRFKETAYGGKIREDGKVLVAGDGSGLIQIFDLQSRSILRSLRGHSGPVHVMDFAPGSPGTLYSGSDDQVVRVWDVPTQTSVLSLQGHEDYIRAGTTLPGSSSLYLTGGYDHRVCLWDARVGEGKPSMEMSHGSPVEALLTLPGSSGLMVGAAGGRGVSLLDLTSGGRSVQRLENHEKTVTALTTDGTGKRLLSGGLDGLVKVYDTSAGQVIHSIKYPGPILSLAMSPDDTHLVAGLSTGVLSIRQRRATAAEKAQRQREVDARIASFSTVLGGLNAAFPQRTIQGGGEDGKGEEGRGMTWVVERERRARLGPYDKMLKSYAFGQALDAALAPNVRPVVTVSVLQELVYRSALRQALSGRDEEGLIPLLTFLSKGIATPRFTPLLMDVVEIVLDIYEGVVAESERVASILARIQGRIAQELSVHQGILELQGMVGMLMSVRGLTEGEGR